MTIELGPTGPVAAAHGVEVVGQGADEEGSFEQAAKCRQILSIWAQNFNPP